MVSERRALDEWENYQIIPQHEDVDHGLSADSDDIQSDTVKILKPSQPEQELEYSDVIDHGPEILEDTESLINEVTIFSKTEAPPPLLDLKKQFYSPSLSKKSLKLLKEQLDGGIQQSISHKKNEFYSPTLSKKSLKLLKEQQKKQLKRQ